MKEVKEEPGFRVRRPALRYHGSKWQLAPWVSSHFPAHRIYVEPFGGSASVLLRKEPAWMDVYNDLDDEVVNFFQVLRDDAEARALIRMLELTPVARAEFETCRTASSERIERARRLVARSYFSFGSAGANIHKRKGFKPPANKLRRGHWNDLLGIPENLARVVRRFKKVVVESLDALTVIEKYDSDETLFYVDPPYPFSSRKVMGIGEYVHELNDQQHVELARRLMGVKGKVVISGYACPLYDRLYADWRRSKREHYASGQRGKVKRTEVLWMNFESVNGA